MPDFEKTVKRTIAELRECLNDDAVSVLVPYETVLNSWDLLKQQEPRVMTLAEALAADYVYLEIKLHASLPCDCCILAIDPDGGILPLKKGFAGYLDGEEYGKTWRCWTQRPTDEQREAAPWP